MKQPKIKKALTPDERARLGKSSASKSRVTGTVMTQWCSSAAAYADEVARSNGNAPAASDGMFWVRLHGVLVEVRDHFTKLDTTSAELQSSGPAHAGVTMYRAWFAAILASVVSARATLSEDELLYAEYRRNVECHLFQDAYTLRVAGDGSLIERRKSNILERDLTIDGEIDGAIRRLLKTHRINEVAIAVDIAKRVAPHLAEVATLVGAYAAADNRAFMRGPPKTR